MTDMYNLKDGDRVTAAEILSCGSRNGAMIFIVPGKLVTVTDVYGEGEDVAYRVRGLASDGQVRTAIAFPTELEA